MKNSLKRLGFFGATFLVSLISIFLVFLIVDTIKDRLIVSLIFAVILTLIIIIFRAPFQKEIGDSQEGTRYTMLCHDCGWEWMSNITPGVKPTRCPNCRSDTLETLGWRKVKIQKKKEQDLRSFFK
ncbi:MAG: hypothetical protein PHT54_01440 [Candidatus Nanoarchaeia archaeon]|nr:hypothetical protein [Candidatus Nanoarchaeia archaeon]